MSQNREPPAYQEYPAHMLSKREFRLMTLVERGLLYTLRLECWINKEVPAKPEDLARYLGVEVSEIEIALTENVLKFFTVKGNSLYSFELEDYRQHLLERKQKQSTGGMNSAAKKRINKVCKDIKLPKSSETDKTSNLEVPYQDTCKSLVELNTEKQSQDKLLDPGINNEWIQSYEANETIKSNDYAQVRE